MPDCRTEGPEAVKADLEGLEGKWNADDCDCYGKASLKGHLFCGGVNDARDIEGNASLMQAYDMGKGV